MRLLLVLLLLIGTATASAAQELVKIDHGFFANGAKWKTSEIPVCWENPRPEDEKFRHLVETAITATWQAYSALKFTGWDSCKAKSTGIRINVQDAWPHVKKLGRKISGLEAGMVLNFEFGIKEFAGCQIIRKLCIKTIAVHEFGHAIGFAHEHNRLDRDKACNEPPQGSSDATALTPYDPSSVMNYCNPKSNNNGKLSKLDIVSLQAIYGAPE